MDALTGLVAFQVTILLVAGGCFVLAGALTDIRRG
jgi:hypothetical protein